MKKTFLILLILILTVFLNGCTNRYAKLNEFVDTVLAEEEGYIFFTHNYKIEGATKINLEEVIANILTKNDIEYDYISFSYILRNNLLFFSMNIKIDKNNRHTRAVIVMDPISLSEILVTTYYVGEKGVHVDFEASSNIIIKDNNQEIVTIYWYEDNVYRKEEIPLNQFNSDEFIFNFEEDWIIDGITYKIEDNFADIKIVANDGDIFYENNLLDMFEKSNVGSEIQKYLKKNNQEIKNIGSKEYDFHFHNNELYIVFRFKMGFLMNQSLFGQTDEIIFRFDFGSKELIYLGNATEYIHYIYS